MDPPWLNGGVGYFATVTGFFDNGIGKRKGDERLSASLAFEVEIECKGLKGKFGFMLGRWQDQVWESSGTVHIHISTAPISSANEITKENSVWAESHAHHEFTES